MKYFQLATNDMICLYGYRVPQCAAYGSINPETAYVCDDFRVYGSGEKTFFKAKVCKIKHTRSVYRVGYDGRTYSVGKNGVVTQVGKRNSRRTEQLLETSNWFPYRIYTDSEAGKRIMFYVTEYYKKFGREPKCIPVSETRNKRNKRISVDSLERRPRHDKPVNPVPTGENNHCFSDVHGGLYNKNGYFKAHIKCAPRVTEKAGDKL